MNTYAIHIHNTYFTLNNCFPENHALYEILGENLEQPDRSQMEI